MILLKKPFFFFFFFFFFFCLHFEKSKTSGGVEPDSDSVSIAATLLFSCSFDTVNYLNGYKALRSFIFEGGWNCVSRDKRHIPKKKKLKEYTGLSLPNFRWRNAIILLA